MPPKPKLSSISEVAAQFIATATLRVDTPDQTRMAATRADRSSGTFTVLENLVGHGVLAGLTGPNGTVLKLRPPLVWEPTHVETFGSALRQALPH